MGQFCTSEKKVRDYSVECLGLTPVRFPVLGRLDHAIAYQSQRACFSSPWLTINLWHRSKSTLEAITSRQEILTHGVNCVKLPDTGQRVSQFRNEWQETEKPISWKKLTRVPCVHSDSSLLYDLVLMVIVPMVRLSIIAPGVESVLKYPCPEICVCVKREERKDRDSEKTRE